MRIGQALRTGNTQLLRPLELREYTEYLYRKTFHLSHDEYLDSPINDIQWMTRIDLKVKEHEEAEAKRASGK